MPSRPRALWGLSIGQDDLDATLVLTVAGRLGHSAAGELHRVLAGLLDSGCRHVIVDLKDVDYVSGAALLAVDSTAGRLRAAGGELVLCGLTHPVRSTLQIARWLERFPIESTRERAIARCRRSTEDRGSGIGSEPS
jgi:stage II sporulation protein AA (anti-sigma F factor antagonist)